MSTLSKIKTLLLLLSAYVTGIGSANAKEPNWMINPASYQYNMTMMAVANISCGELTNAGNRIGVFLGDECRGSALTGQVINGRFIASLFIYSNVYNGEKLTFKIYDAYKDTLYDAKVSVQFQQNAAYGTGGSPYVIYNKFPCYVNKEILPASNFISPNEDGKNDYFEIDDVASYYDFALTVYNEQGLEVYKSANNYKNDWGGTYDGKILPTGAYLYAYKNAATAKEYKGIINIIKTN